MDISCMLPVVCKCSLEGAKSRFLFLVLTFLKPIHINFFESLPKFIFELQSCDKLVLYFLIVHCCACCIF